MQILGSFMLNGLKENENVSKAFIYSINKIQGHNAYNLINISKQVHHYDYYGSKIFGFSQSEVDKIINNFANYNKQKLLKL